MDVNNVEETGIHSKGQESQRHSLAPKRAEVMVVSQSGSVAQTGGRAGPNNSPLQKTGPLLVQGSSVAGRNPIPGSWGLLIGPRDPDGGQEGVALWS